MTKWIIGLSIIMVAGVIFGSLMTGGDLEEDISGPDGTFGTIVEGWSYMSSGSIVGLVQGVIVLPFGIIKALGAILFFDPQYWRGIWVIFKLLIFYPIGIGVVVSLILQLRGSSG